MSDLIVIQRWLGHSSLGETLDTYSHYLKSGSETMSPVLDIGRHGAGDLQSTSTKNKNPDFIEVF
jgi:hypothetical protein